jgi:hypothetical protein
MRIELNFSQAQVLSVTSRPACSVYFWYCDVCVIALINNFWLIFYHQYFQYGSCVNFEVEASLGLVLEYYTDATKRSPMYWLAHHLP